MSWSLRAGAPLLSGEPRLPLDSSRLLGARLAVPPRVPRLSRRTRWSRRTRLSAGTLRAPRRRLAESARPVLPGAAAILLAGLPRLPLACRQTLRSHLAGLPRESCRPRRSLLPERARLPRLSLGSPLSGVPGPRPRLRLPVLSDRARLLRRALLAGG
ncbi:hypothetical protein ACIBFB_17875 [Nocardiopsis sp. NPDC050513]|uniref:hypothetical protein n=1 Tax=Nocardiopsis sp. NPDC050513 TaxID=3364338 RepID=UPI0037A8DAF0